MVLLESKDIVKKIYKDIENRKKELTRDLKAFKIIYLDGNKASEIYVKRKKKACDKLGIPCNLKMLSKNATSSEIVDSIKKANEKPHAYGALIVQLPLPFSPEKNTDIINNIEPQIDVDCLTSSNIGNFFQTGNEKYAPCTPKGIMKLLENYNIPLEGKTVCIINSSNIVGKPLIQMLLNRGATPIVCYKNTPLKKIQEYSKESDILISAVGIPGFITKDFVTKKSVVVDVGISRVGKRVVGDVDFDGVKDIVHAITPVPGGVGPLTVACLLENVFDRI